MLLKCVKSLCSKVDITEGLLKPPVLVHWPDCEICLQPPTSWVKLQLEIYEGAADILFEKLQKNLNSSKVRLTQASLFRLSPIPDGQKSGSKF